MGTTMLYSGRRVVADFDSEEDPSELDEEELEDGCSDRFRQETWVEWVRRTTTIVEEHLHSSGLDDWVTLQRKRKWAFAGHVARRQDSRWSHKVLKWIPTEGHRLRGHPAKRWRDSLDDFFKQLGFHQGDWMVFAEERKGWANLAEDFVLQI